MSRILKDAVMIAEYGRILKMAGAEAARKNVELSPSIGIFTEAFPEWKNDGKIQAAGSICKYQKIAYLCRRAVVREEYFRPDKATQYYHPFPEPDEDGIYPYTYGMSVIEGMKVRDPNGKKYKAFQAIQEQLNPPSELSSAFMEI